MIELFIKYNQIFLNQIIQLKKTINYLSKTDNFPAKVILFLMKMQII